MNLATTNPRAGTRYLFFIAGLAIAAWAAIVPKAQQRLQLEPGGLGLLLLCLGLGSLLAMPIAGALVSRHGVRRVLVVATLLVITTLPYLAIASTPWMMGVVLFGFGAGIGAIDCATSIQSVIVEQVEREPLMSGFHAFYSIGGIVGAAGMSAALSFGASPLASMLGVAVLVALLLARAVGGLLPHGDPSGGPALAVPRGIVLLLGALTFAVFLAEGAILDWSAVFLADTHRMATARAGLGYASFALAMTVGRLSGDRLVALIGPRAVLAVGGLVAAAGIGIATLGPSWQLALFGYALVGLGSSNVVPVVFTAAGRQTAMPQSVAIPAVSTLGYAGVLVGPAAIGLIAHLASLQLAFVLVMVLLLGVAASSVAAVFKR